MAEFGRPEQHVDSSAVLGPYRSAVVAPIHDVDRASEGLNEGKNLLFTSPHVMLFPGAAVAVTVAGFNLVGEALCETAGLDAVRTPWL